MHVYTKIYTCIVHLQTGKTTVIRRKGVREACVSQHQENVIDGLSETPQTITQCGIEGFKGNPQLGLHLTERRQFF